MRKAVQLDPHNANAWMSLGAIQIAGNRVAEAEQTYKRVSELGIAKYRPIHAIFLYQTGKLDAALAEFEAQAKTNPNDRDARLRLFQTYIALKKYGEADKLIAAALKRNPKDNDILLLKSEWDLQRGQGVSAEKNLQQVLRAQPDSALGHYRMARAKASRGLTRDAEQELTEALRLSPGLLPARLLLARTYLATDASKSALQVIDEAPGGQARQKDAVLERNWALFALGRYPELRQQLDEALKSDRDPTLLLQGAMLRVSQRDNDGARVLIDELLKQEPANSRAAYLLVQTYFEQKQLPKGLERLQEIAKANPKAPDIQHVLGQWYMRAGQHDDARRAFEAAKMLDPKFLPSLLALADLDIRDDRIEAARARLTEVLRVDPRNQSALIMMAGVDDRLSNRADAIAKYQTILSMDSSNMAALNNLAYDLALERPDEALKPAQQAAELAPKSAAVQDTLGFVYYRKGLYTLARERLQMAVSLETTPLYQFHLGMCYLKLGEQTLGESTVRAALAKDANLLRTQIGW
jgi:tetratricopeptide (TPR) repeat protein